MRARARPAPGPRSTARRRARTDLIVVHCAATPPSMDVGAREIDRWHRARGFREIGYHFVVRRNGSVEPGRRVEEIGAHARGQNHHSLGICLVGGRGEQGGAEANFTAAQYEALWRLLEGLAPRYPTADVLGHADLPGVNKACPCFDVQRWMTARAAQAPPTPPASAPSAVSDDPDPLDQP